MPASSYGGGHSVDSCRRFTLVEVAEAPWPRGSGEIGSIDLDETSHGGRGSATEIARIDYPVSSDGRHHDDGADEHEVLRRELAGVVDQRQVAEISAEGSGCVIHG